MVFLQQLIEEWIIAGLESKRLNRVGRLKNSHILVILRIDFLQVNF
jgi:hypothetical protein